MKSPRNIFMNYSVGKNCEGPENRKVQEVHLSRDKINTTHIQRQCKRKFPGPAGILPPPNDPDNYLKDNLHVTSDSLPQADNKKLKMKDEPTSTEDIFSSEVWRSLADDLGPDSDKILDKFSIRSSVLKASKKLLHRGKIALILGVIDNLDMQGSDVSFVIRDPTGKMKGSFHPDILKDYESVLHAGSVLILRQVSVISPSPRTHYLNVTPANVVMVYTADKNEGLIKHTFQDAKLNNSTTHRVESLRDIVKESENELNMSLQHFRENCTSTSMNLSAHKFSSPVRLSTPVRQSTPVRITTPVRLSTPVRITTPVRQSTPQLFSSSFNAAEIHKTCAINSMHQASHSFKSTAHNPGRNNDRATFSSTASAGNNRAAPGSLNSVRVISNPPIKEMSTGPSSHAASNDMFLLEEDDDLLQMCDIYPDQFNNTTEVHSTSSAVTNPFRGQVSSNKQSGNTSSDWTKTMHETHPSVSSASVKNSFQVNQPPKNSPSDPTELNMTEIERDSRIQLQHSGQPLVASEEFYPHWENDLTTDLLLSQLSEDF